MKEETKNKMADIIKAAMEKANNNNNTPTSKPVSAPVIPPVIPINHLGQELSNVNLNDLMNDTTAQPVNKQPQQAKSHVKRKKAAKAVAPAKQPEKIMDIFDYSEWSVCVQTFQKPSDEILSEFRSLNGRFNTRLKRNGNTITGWCFSKKVEKQVREVIASYLN